VLPALFRRQLRLIIIGDGITHITIGGITTHTSTEAITTNIAIAGITIGAAPGLSASTGVQDIIGIGKRITVARSPFFEKQAQTPAIDSTYSVL
jgi:hypothetical protein